MSVTSSTFSVRRHRHARIRAKIRGSRERPRLAVFRSLKHISAQIIDDSSGKTIVSASDHDVAPKTVATVERALKVGKLIAERARAAHVTHVVFDRGGHAYHGQVKALAEGARTAGLTF